MWYKSLFLATITTRIIILSSSILDNPTSQPTSQPTTALQEEISFNVTLSLDGISKSSLSSGSTDILIEALAVVVEGLDSDYISIATIIDVSSRRQLHNNNNIKLSSLSTRFVIAITAMVQKLGFVNSVTAYNSFKQR